MTVTSICDAASLESIRSALTSLHARDVAITDRLNELIASQADLSRQLGRLDLLRAHLGNHVVHTRTVGGMLEDAADTAHHLSGTVHTLDLEKKRVEETLAVVEQVAELKACVHGVVGSMGAPQDWEAAAGYLSRARRVPDAIRDGAFASRVVPSVEVPDAPAVTLEEATESLCALFLREFEHAAAAGDGVLVTRFFKLFPLIGRTQVGLDAYGKYVCQGVAATARKNLRDAGDNYSAALTKLFEHLAQIIEGHGGLVERHYGPGTMATVIERLQVEADVQGGIIVETWAETRQIDRRLTDVKSYPFSFLVQSYLGGAAPQDEGVDLKDVDGLLSEMGVMLGSWALYQRFVAGKSFVALSKSGLARKISTRLVAPFHDLSMFFFRRSVEKAFQLEEWPALSLTKPLDANPPYVLSTVDDVMYIVKAVMDRAVSTRDPAILATVSATVSRVLGSDYIGMLQRKMRDDTYPKANVQGGFPPEDKIVAFITLINSLDVTNDYLARIVSDTSLVTAFTTKSSELITDGLHVMFNQVVKLRLRPILSDTFRDVDYSDETDVVSKFAYAWEHLMKPIQRIMTARSFEVLLEQTARYLSRWMEKRIWSFSGKVDADGGVRLERDFHGLITSITAAKYGLRELFVRVIEILTIVNMEADEWEEIDGNWTLSDEDRHRARNFLTLTESNRPR